ncbi:MAG: hypothetical protein ABEL76_04995 [Bradymonadaceae bacterium]
MTNRQDDNVGNRGDILKHGALVRLADLAAQRAIRGPVTYIDTHAYQLEAGWNDPLSWKQAINKQMAEYPGYTDYLRREKEQLDRDEPYRCSAGLVLDIISERNYQAILAESDDETRRTLKTQVRSSGYRVDYFLEDAAELEEVPVPEPEDDDEDDPGAGSLLVLVDPFELDPNEWDHIAAGVERFTEEETEGIIEVFHYADRETVDWPDPPTHFVGPVATLDDRPYHLAAYATDPILERVLPELEKLGWTSHHTEDD